MISDQIVHLIIIHRYSTIVALILCHNKIRNYLGIFPKRGGRGSPIPKTGCKNVTQNVIFWEKFPNNAVFCCDIRSMRGVQHPARPQRHQQLLRQVELGHRGFCRLATSDPGLAATVPSRNKSPLNSNHLTNFSTFSCCQ